MIRRQDQLSFLTERKENLKAQLIENEQLIVGLLIKYQHIQEDAIQARLNIEVRNFMPVPEAFNSDIAQERLAHLEKGYYFLNETAQTFSDAIIAVQLEETEHLIEVHTKADRLKVELEELQTFLQNAIPHRQTTMAHLQIYASLAQAIKHLQDGDYRNALEEVGSLTQGSVCTGLEGFDNRMDFIGPLSVEMITLLDHKPKSKAEFSQISQSQLNELDSTICTNLREQAVLIETYQALENENSTIKTATYTFFHSIKRPDFLQHVDHDDAEKGLFRL